MYVFPWKRGPITNKAPAPRSLPPSIPPTVSGRRILASNLKAKADQAQSLKQGVKQIKFDLQPANQVSSRSAQNRGLTKDKGKNQLKTKGWSRTKEKFRQKSRVDQNRGRMATPLKIKTDHFLCTLETLTPDVGKDVDFILDENFDLFSTLETLTPDVGKDVHVTLDENLDLVFKCRDPDPRCWKIC